ncbi:MAG: sensor histidine kinase [Vicinamibacteraceae bacterium]
MALLPLLLAVVIASAMSAPASAERLAIRTYTTTDGLPNDRVDCAYRDSRGFLWVCTAAGLARFDGQIFTSYTNVPGLPDGVVLDLIETRDGTIWIGTTEGISHFDPRVRSDPTGSTVAGRRRFRTYLPAQASNAERWGVYAFVEAADGTLWAGAIDGLYRRQPAGNDWRFERVVPGVSVLSLAEDQTGSLWVGTTTGLLRRDRTGRVDRFGPGTGLLGPGTAEPAAFDVRAVFLDVEGRLWISVIGYGVCRLLASTDVPQAEFCYTGESGLVDTLVSSMTQSEDGSLWMASHRGPMQIVPPFDGSRARLRTFEDHEELSFRAIAVTADRDDNIWLSTLNVGLVRIVGGGFTRYGAEDGLTQDWAPTLFLDRAGTLHHVFADRISRFDGERFVGARLPISRPSRQRTVAWGWTQAVAQDRHGRWWVATDQGAYRFPAVQMAHLATTHPDLTLGTGAVSVVFVERSGAVWSCTVGLGPREQRCFRQRPASRAVDVIDWSATGAPNADVFAIAEDHHGQVWLGLTNGGLVRYAARRLTAYGVGDGVPGPAIRALHVDRRGRLWVGSSHGGLARLDDPRAGRPRFATYTRHEGLSSETVYSIAEDRFGRIYLGTATGLDQLDPDTGKIRHFTAHDGLGAGRVHAVLADAEGAIWFATTREVTRFVPHRDVGQSVRLARIMRVRVDGQDLPLSDLGERQVGGVEIGPGEHHLQIDFGSTSLATGELLRYQHRLVGADTRWSEPGSERSITYGNLRPGRYRFEVRTSSTPGAASAAPAVASFVILPPIWQRWWFLLLAGATAALAIYGVHRLKLERAVAVERMRMRIATDLHDDIGGTLSRMAIVSEVAKRQTALPPEVERRLDDLAETARGLVDTMSDVIWSIDPRRDHLGDLLLRVREHAADVLDGTALSFEGPVGAEAIGLSPEQRRQLYLILKEALTNVAKHASAQHVVVAAATSGHQLDVEVRDDGRGFDARTPSSADTWERHADDDGRARRTMIHRGNGLTNMRARAAALGGSLTLRSGTNGTTLQVEVPLVRPTRSRRLRALASSLWRVAHLDRMERSLGKRPHDAEST